MPRCPIVSGPARPKTCVEIDMKAPKIEIGALQPSRILPPIDELGRLRFGVDSVIASQSGGTPKKFGYTQIGTIPGTQPHSTDGTELILDHLPGISVLQAQRPSC